MKRFLLLLVLLSSAAVLAQENNNEPAPADSKQAGDIPESRVDRQKQAVDSKIQRASSWVDSFFADPSYEAEDANTLVRIRPEYYYRNEQGGKFKLKVGIKFQLPNIGRNVSLVAGNEDSVDSFGDSNEDTSADPAIGLQFFGRSSARWHSSISAGVKFDEFAGFIGPRVRYLRPWGESKSIRFTQAVRYQTNAYWNTISRLDFNFIVNDSFYFRQTFDGRWRGERSDDEGFRTRISSILTQGLKEDAGLQYDFSTVFHTRPDTHVDRYTLALRYRKRTSREWLYYEVVPQVSFDHDYDYDFNPGIRLRLEVFFGQGLISEFSKHKHEDRQDFRW
jgi:hypothetical protein